MYYNRGISYSLIEKHEEALKDYKKTIDINPEFEEVYYYAGFSYYLLEEYSEAIEYFTIAIEINIDYEQAYYGRADRKSTRLNSSHIL